MTLPHTWRGPRAGAVLVLGNSLGTTQRMWDGLLAELGAATRVLTFDLLGHTGAAAEPFTFEDLVAATIELLEAEHVRAATFAGISLGGALGVGVAARRPDLVDRLVVVNAPLRQASREFWLDRADAVERDGLGGLAAGLPERWFPRGGAAADAVVADFAALDPAGYAAACRALADLDITAAAVAVRAPTVVVSALDDASVPPEHSAELAALIPGAVLETVADGGHLLPVTRPDVVAALLVTGGRAVA